MRKYKDRFFSYLVDKKVISGSSDIRKMLVNIFWLSSDKVIRYGLGLIVGIWVARYLGPNDFGVINYAISIYTIFTAFYTFGLDSVVVKHLVQAGGEKNKILGTAFWMRISGSLLALSLIAIVSRWSSYPQYYWIILVISFSPLFQVFDVIDFWFQSVTQSKYTVLSKAFALLIVLGLRIALILFEASLIWFAWATAIEFLFSSIALIIIYNKKVGNIFSWYFDLRIAKTFIKESWPVAVSLIATLVYFRSGQIMLSELSDMRAVGIYSAAIRLSEVWYFLPVIFFTSAYPNLIKAKQADETLFYSKLKKLYKIMIWLALIVTIVIIMSADMLITFLYKDTYKDAVLVLRIHVLGLVFTFIGQAAQAWYLIEQKNKLALYNNVLGAIVCIVANYLLIPSFGVSGAAVASVLAFMVCNYLSLALFKSSRNNFYLISKSFWPF